jgi:hypothetical protein
MLEKRALYRQGLTRNTVAVPPALQPCTLVFSLSMSTSDPAFRSSCESLDCTKRYPSSISWRISLRITLQEHEPLEAVDEESSGLSDILWL